jgi:hypothetical protein
MSFGSLIGFIEHLALAIADNGSTHSTNHSTTAHIKSSPVVVSLRLPTMKVPQFPY